MALLSVVYSILIRQAHLRAACGRKNEKKVVQSAQRRLTVPDKDRIGCRCITPTAGQCSSAKPERFTFAGYPVTRLPCDVLIPPVRLLQVARWALWVVIRIIHTINCSYHMPSYGERHSQYMHIRFATCSDSERVTAYGSIYFKGQQPQLLPSTTRPQAFVRTPLL